MGPLLALLLLAEPQAAPQDEGPVATVSRQAVTAQQAATPLPGEAEYTPTGAPEDDYAFVGWCHGVLSGHRDLAEALGQKLVKDEKDRELEADLDKIGTEYLDLYQRALLTAEMTRSRAATERAVLARDNGYARWRDALYAAKNDGKDESGRAIDVEGSYVGWSLPGRCEHASKRLLDVVELSDAYKLKPVAGATMTASVDGPAKAEQAAAEPAAVAETPAPKPAKAGGESLWSRIKRFGRN